MAIKKKETKEGRQLVFEKTKRESDTERERER